MTEPRRISNEGAAPLTAFESRCGKCHCVLQVSRLREDVVLAGAVHWMEQHDFDGALVVGEHIYVGPAPYRCDLCGTVVEPPWWGYRTWTEPGYEPEDPGWLVCDTCHGIIAGNAKPLARLVEHCFQTQLVDTASGLSPALMRRTLKEQVRAFLDHVEGEPVRGSA